MKPIPFSGAATALITPMNSDKSLNLPAFRLLVEEQISHGIDALVVGGTTGESATLSLQEYANLLAAAVDTAKGRVPILAGAGSNDTAHSLEKIYIAQDIGADALLLVTPYYNKTTQLGLIRHFNTLADRSKLPAILYNVPSRTGLNIQPKTYQELCKHPNIAAVKEASGDISQIAETVHLCGDDLILYSGNDDQVVPILSLGGKGVISVLSNLIPWEVHQLCQRFFDGDVAGSLQLQLDFLPLIRALFCEVNPIPVKTAMELTDHKAGPCRLPLVDASQETRERLSQVLLNLGLMQERR